MVEITSWHLRILHVGISRDVHATDKRDIPWFTHSVYSEQKPCHSLRFANQFGSLFGVKLFSFVFCPKAVLCQTSYFVLVALFNETAASLLERQEETIFEKESDSNKLTCDWSAGLWWNRCLYLCTGKRQKESLECIRIRVLAKIVLSV